LQEFGIKLTLILHAQNLNKLGSTKCTNNLKLRKIARYKYFKLYSCHNEINSGIEITEAHVDEDVFVFPYTP
jgi:hypothetical protein